MKISKKGIVSDYGLESNNEESMAKVLVVDDESGVRELVKTYLEYSGIEVMTAGDGLEAIHVAKSGGIDVVLTDILMPHMDGLALAGELKKMQPDTVVILMTGYASVNTAVEAIKQGVFDYIMKPFQNMQIVIHAIHRAVERKQLIEDRRKLIEDLKHTNDELEYHRQLLMEKVWKTDAELVRRVERLSTLYEISRNASSVGQLDHLLQSILDKISGAMNDSPGILWLFDGRRESLRRVASVRIQYIDTVPGSIGSGDGSIGEVIRENRARVFHYNENLSDPLFRKICEEEQAFSLVVVPLSFEESVLGVFTMFFPEETPVTDDDVSLLTAVADQVSVSIRNAELFANQQRLFHETIEALATVIDSRDHYTGSHSYMVTKYSLIIAQKMGFDEERIELIRLAGFLHDIGKIGISDLILNKPGKLTDEEMEVIKSHPIIGRMIVESIEALKPAARIIFYHHEHYDGSGYPEGIKGDDIPLESRILQVADIFHALTSDRIYRKALSVDEAIAVIRGEMGRVIDPDIGETFLEIIESDDFDLGGIQILQLSDERKVF
jgi:putative nucleotidyltransferase with HDIG domain